MHSAQLLVLLQGSMCPVNQLKSPIQGCTQSQPYTQVISEIHVTAHSTPNMSDYFTASLVLSVFTCLNTQPFHLTYGQVTEEPRNIYVAHLSV
jgi:hypothetical protein